MRRLFIISFLCWLTACSESKDDSSKSSGKLNIVCTTSMIGDMVRNITGDKADVVVLMGPGVDPHLHKAVQSDRKKLQNADIIIYNGLHLEGKMTDMLENLSKRKKVVALSNGLPESMLRKAEGFESYDPHIWFDVKLWALATQNVMREISEFDPDNKDIYFKQYRAFAKDLEGLDLWINNEMSSINEFQRVLITAHDAFGYFGNAYDVEVKGLQGISTVSQAGIKERKELVDLIIERKIKAIFVETSISEKQLKAIVEDCKARNHEVKIGGKLYSDAMGAPDSEGGTYIGMVKSNVKTIVNALK